MRYPSAVLTLEVPMSTRITTFVVAGLVALFAAACDSTWTLDDPATESGALIVLDEVTPAVTKVLDIELLPTEALTSLHGMVEHRVLVQVMATYDPIPGPDPDPAELIVELRGQDVVTTHGMVVTLFDGTPTVIHLAAIVDARCLAMPGCLELAADRLDLSGGVLTLELLPD